MCDVTDLPSFGGEWTKVKLDMVERYLDAYTTALKKQSFELWYIDAFAGAGRLYIRSGDVEEYIDGSAMRAINVTDKQFDKLVFVEVDLKRVEALQMLKDTHSDRHITLVNDDFNKYIHNMPKNWSSRRGVLFLDPFGATVNWASIEQIAGLNALDMWILFPAAGISRFMPTRQNPDEMSGWSSRLDSVFGGDRWRDLYPTTQTLNGNTAQNIRMTNNTFKKIVEIYKDRLRDVYGERLLKKSRTLKKGNMPLFELIFCVGNMSPRAIDVAKKIARHIIERNTAGTTQTRLD